MHIRKNVITASVSPEELEKAEKIARERYEKKAPDDKDVKKFEDDYSGLDINLWGAIAEIVWARLTNWEMREELIEGGDDGVDFTHGDSTYQLKTRNTDRFDNPDLLCRKDYAKADRYILSEISASDLSRVRFIGWCTLDELTENTTTIGNKGERYIRNRDDLRPIPRNILVDGTKRTT